MENLPSLIICHGNQNVTALLPWLDTSHDICTTVMLLICACAKRWSQRRALCANWQRWYFHMASPLMKCAEKKALVQGKLFKILCKLIDEAIVEPCVQNYSVGIFTWPRHSWNVQKKGTGARKAIQNNVLTYKYLSCWLAAKKRTCPLWWVKREPALCDGRLL